MTSKPYPINTHQHQREAIESIKAQLDGKPTYTDIIRKALDIGLNQLTGLPREKLAREIRGY